MPRGVRVLRLVLFMYFNKNGFTCNTFGESSLLWEATLLFKKYFCHIWITIQIFLKREKPAKGEIRKRHRRDVELCVSWILALWLCMGYSSQASPLPSGNKGHCRHPLLSDVGKNTRFGARQTWIRILALLLTSFMILGKNLPSSDSTLPLLGCYKEETRMYT